MKKINKTTIFGAALAFALCGCAASSDNNPLIYDIETVKVFESPAEQKPGHNAWPAVFVDKDGGVCVVFQQIIGDLSEKPSYNFRLQADKYTIKRICVRAEKGSTKFEKIWEAKMQSAHSFFIPVPTAAPDGKMLAMCLPSSGEEFKKFPEKSIVIVESDDYGKTLKVRSNIVVDGIDLYPNDIRYIGKRLYLASYDGKGAAHLFYSDDDGYTWSKPLEIVKAHDNQTFHEPTFCETSNGGLIVLLRTHRMDIPKHNGINYRKVYINKNADGTLAVVPGDEAISNSFYFDEEGKCQLSPIYETPFGFRGRPFVQKGKDDTIIFVAPGHFMAFSKDDGKTWFSGEFDFNIERVKITDSFGTKPFNWNAETTLTPLPDGRYYYSYFIGSDYPFPAPCDMYIGGTFFRIRGDK